MQSSPDTQNLAAVLDVHAATRGAHPAVIAGDGVWTHRELAARVRQLAVALAAEGVAEGDLVGLGMSDGAEHVAAMFALARLGAILLPMDCRWGPQETRSLAVHFRPRLILRDDPAPIEIGPSRAGPGDAAPADPAPAGLQAGHIRVLATARLRALADAADPAAAAAPAPGGDRPLLISLSSGTTGRPKGPAITHAQMLHRFVNQTVSLTFNWYDRFVVATPLYFGGGRTFALSFLYLGATIVLLPPPWKPEELIATMARHRPTALFLVPTLLRRMLALPDAALAPFRALRLLISSGAPLHPREREAVCARLSPQYFEYYASTEGGGITVLAPSDRAAHGDSVGRMAFRVELEVVGEDHAPLPPGEVGRIRYRGPGVATGFFRDPEADAEAFRDGWFYPGDLGVLDAEGFLSLRGRSRDMIIRGGANIYPVEIEQVIAQVPGVRDVAVVGLAHAEFGEEVCAVLVADAGLTAEAVVAECRARLAAYKVPRHVRFVDELPRNSAGKVLKARLAEAVAPG